VHKVISDDCQSKNQCAKADSESSAHRPSEILIPLWLLSHNHRRIRGNTLERILYVVDQEVSCLARTLKAFARETENFAELVNRVLRIVRYIL
jgi:hypothetical protein